MHTHSNTSHPDSQSDTRQDTKSFDDIHKSQIKPPDSQASMAYNREIGADKSSDSTSATTPVSPAETDEASDTAKQTEHKQTEHKQTEHKQTDQDNSRTAPLKSSEAEEQRAEQYSAPEARTQPVVQSDENYGGKNRSGDSNDRNAIIFRWIRNAAHALGCAIFHPLYGPHERWFLCASIFFLEVVLKASTTGKWFPQIIYLLLLSIALGQILQVICALPLSKRYYDTITRIVLTLLGVVFSIFYFVFVQFKIFYDPQTVLGGAGGVASQFLGAALNIVGTPSGLIHIVLFFTPRAVYSIARHTKLLRPYRERHRGILRSLIVTTASFVFALLIIFIIPTYRYAYWSRYSFHTNVEDFGLLNSLGREASRTIFGTHTDFDLTNVTSTTKVSTSSSTDDTAFANLNAYGFETDVPVEMDLDLEALAESTDISSLKTIDEYVSTLTPSTTNEMTGIFYGKNLIFISAEALSAEAIRKDTTPTLYRMATRGIQFTDYYQPENAGTTGGECQNIFGLLSLEGGSSVKLTSTHNNYFTIGNVLNRLGYNGWAFHNNTYTYYDRDQTHINLGYNNGYMGYGNGMEQWVNQVWPESDLEMVEGTFDNLYGDQAPFNIYYMSVSGHSNYDKADNTMSAKNWNAVSDLDYSDRVKGYLACQVELDSAMEYLIGRLEELGIADDTVIVISADHFPYGLDDDAALGKMPYLSELYGYEVENYFQRDHNRLIIWSGCLEDDDPIVVDEPTCSIDILPTLLNLFGAEWDSRLLPGRDVFSDTTPLVMMYDYSWKTDLGTYYASTDTFEAQEGAEIPDGYVDQMNTIVANKFSFSKALLDNDYYRHLFGDPGDVEEVNEAGKAANTELIDAAQAAYISSSTSSKATTSDD